MLDGSMQAQEAGQLYSECSAMLASGPEGEDVPIEKRSSPEEVEQWQRTRQAALLYVSKQLVVPTPSDRTSPHRYMNGGLPLSRIVESANVGLLELFEELPVLVQQLRPHLVKLVGSEEEVESRLSVRSWQASMVVGRLLAKKYQDLLRGLLAGRLEGSGALALWGWLLFALLKSRLLPRCPDLVSCMEMLVAVVNLVVAQVPESEWLPPLSAVPKCGSEGAGSSPLSTLAAVCLASKVDLGRARVVMNTVDAHASQLMVSAAVKWRMHTQPRHPRVDSCCSYYEGLHADTRGVADCISYFDKQYDAFYLAHGELDDRQMLAVQLQGDTVQLPPRPNPGPPAPPSSTHTPSLVPPGLHSPLPAMRLAGTPLDTPVSGTLSAASWLRAATMHAAEEPSPALLNYFAACDPAVGPAIQRCIQTLILRVFPDSMQLPSNCLQLQSAAAKEKRTEAVKLFYRALERLLTLEHHTTGRTSFTQILTSSMFHRCLLAIVCELVAAAYRIAPLQFPQVANRLLLQPFDLSKLIDPFVRSDPSLPRDLKHHLYKIEEQVTESLAWAPGSVLFTVISNATGTPEPEESEAMQEAQQEAPNGQSPTKSPLKSKRSAVPSSILGMSFHKRPRVEGAPGLASPREEEAAADAPHYPDAVGALDRAGPGDPGARNALKDFFRKVLKLSAFRLTELCRRLDFSPRDPQRVLSDVYDVVEAALQHGTRLFYGRHLDQLLLSTLYGYCKVHKLHRVSFREIINQYRKAGDVREEVYRSVPLQQAANLQALEYGDIITFYNSIFIPVMKPHLLAKGPGAQDAGAASQDTGTEGSQHSLGDRSLPPTGLGLARTSSTLGSEAPPVPRRASVRGPSQPQLGGRAYGGRQPLSEIPVTSSDEAEDMGASPPAKPPANWGKTAPPPGADPVPLTDSAGRPSPSPSPRRRRSSSPRMGPTVGLLDLAEAAAQLEASGTAAGATAMDVAVPDASSQQGCTAWGSPLAAPGVGLAEAALQQSLGRLHGVEASLQLPGEDHHEDEGAFDGSDENMAPLEGRGAEASEQLQEADGQGRRMDTDEPQAAA